MIGDPKIESVEVFLKRKLQLPVYQRPYKWSVKSVGALLDDIKYAIDRSKEYAGYKYRLGTIILKGPADILKQGPWDIVDGQQRLVTLALIYKALGEANEIPILQEKISSKVSAEGLRRNLAAIRTFFAAQDKKEDYREAMCSLLEFVVITTDQISEAFQIFDSQNTRGRALDPHDLLKAYHLRAMRDRPAEMNKAVDMNKAVEKWEQRPPEEIRLLFRDYLFPIKNWVEQDNRPRFSAADIDEFKGVASDWPYAYARRTVKGMPIFQIDQPLEAGQPFFEYVEHYLKLLKEVQAIAERPLELLFKGRGAVGFAHAKQLFWGVVLYYYDRFGNLDDLVIKRLYAWAFRLRLEMKRLGYATVCNYAIGGRAGAIPMFYKLRKCLKESDVLKIPVPPLPPDNGPDDGRYKEYKELYDCLSKILGWKGDRV